MLDQKYARRTSSLSSQWQNAPPGMPPTLVKSKTYQAPPQSGLNSSAALCFLLFPCTRIFISSSFILPASCVSLCSGDDVLLRGKSHDLAPSVSITEVQYAARPVYLSLPCDAPLTKIRQRIVKKYGH